MTAPVDIVIVDDDQLFLEFLGQALASDYRIHAFACAHEALRYLTNNDATLLVTDLRMPGLNGFMLINEARRLRPSLKILLISGYLDPSCETDQDIVSRYTANFLAKPFKLPEIRGTIASMLADAIGVGP